MWIAEAGVNVASEGSSKITNRFWQIQIWKVRQLSAYDDFRHRKNCFVYFTHSFPLLLVLVVKIGSKINGLCPEDHILFCHVQYIMPINQQNVCNL